MIKLTSQQQLILDANEKRIVVLACPGSGKTTMIAEKIASLKNKNSLDLKRILCITFTRRAAKEMQDKLEELMPLPKSIKKNISTMHSFGARLIYAFKDKLELKDDYRIATISEKEDIIRNIDTNFFTSDEMISSFLSYVSGLKNGMDVNKINKYDFKVEQFNLFNELMKERGLIDLDDFIYLSVKLLKENPEIKDKTSHRFDYIFVDEYQDINQMQDDLLNLLINDESHVMYVGDDDQAIYEFRGSKVDYILDKGKPDSGYKVYYLSTNFRSQKGIVDLSKKVLSQLNSTTRLKKDIKAYKSDNTNKPYRPLPFKRKEDELNFVINEIKRLVMSGKVALNQIAVLSRFSSKSRLHEINDLRAIQDGLNKYGINCIGLFDSDKEKEKEKRISRIALSLIKFHDSNFDPESLNFDGNKIYVAKKFESILNLINFKYNRNYQITDNFESTMDEIINNNYQIDDKSVIKRFDRLVKYYKFVKSQRELIKKDGMPSDVTYNMLSFITSDGKEISDSENETYQYIISYARQAEKDYGSIELDIINDVHVDDIKNPNNNDPYLAVCNSILAFLPGAEKEVDKNAVRLMTIHQSKGLQFDIVFVIGLTVGDFPCDLDGLDEDVMINERRLFYVAITRARELLYLTSYGYKVENSKDGAGKSLIYDIAEDDFFQDKVAPDLEKIKFELNDDLYIRLLNEKESALEELEDKESIHDLELANKVEQINKLLNENSELKDLISKKDQEYLSSHSEIKSYKEANDEINHRLQVKQNRIDQLNKEKQDALMAIANEKKRNLLQKSINDRDKQKISDLNNTLTLIKKDLNKAQLDLDVFKAGVANKVNKLTKENELLRNTKKPKEEVKVITKTIVKYVERKSNANVQKQIINASPDYFSGCGNLLSDEQEDIKNDLINFHNRKIIHTNLKEDLDVGLSNLSKMVKFTYEYQNNEKDAKVYLGLIQSNNFKGNFDWIIKNIINYFALLNNGRPNTDVPAFTLNFYNPKKQTRIIKQFKTRFNIKDDSYKDLMNDMFTLYSLTTTSNHTYNNSPKLLQNDHKTMYQEQVNNFLNYDFKHKLDVLFSFAKFISKCLKDEELVLYFNNSYNHNEY